MDFWATWCGSCVVEFPAIEDTLRMYADRDFQLVTVSANMPDEKAGVQRFLEKHHATSRNLLFGSDDTEAMQKAFDPGGSRRCRIRCCSQPMGRFCIRRRGRRYAGAAPGNSGECAGGICRLFEILERIVRSWGPVLRCAGPLRGIRSPCGHP